MFKKALLHAGKWGELQVLAHKVLSPSLSSSEIPDRRFTYSVQATCHGMLVCHVVNVPGEVLAVAIERAEKEFEQFAVALASNSFTEAEELLGRDPGEIYHDIALLRSKGLEI